LANRQMRKRRDGLSILPDDPVWYRDAIIYELHVKSFYDGEGNGVGNFIGLIDKLDYLEDLGVTALWLLPFYPSPLKDDGYDISDYIGIQPTYGDMQDFKTFVDEAHRRGLRVVTELVVNHTSDQHPWFQRARRSPRGSRWRDFYVWSDTPDKYREARIIFKDYESSNWTWDHVANSYYWHRFYAHQPDLNYDNPSVRRAIFKVMDHWLNLGVDGLRADAVPYLCEKEGTNCENLPETHAFLSELRQHIDKKYKNRMLLAEANQWPEDAVAYFGEGDEFHMAFHFPLMPRLFMAIRMEDRFPIIDILEQTPAIPDTCQWALFLRNHDELTLEMVTDEERDYMYRVYAQDPAARLNLGIRRRLAPLLNNDRKKIELMDALLFSMPGTPVIYYGDEIGMGDNFYLGDRNGVRTPMQWSPERNAGFSRANPQKLFLPPIIDPEYHFEAVNVENQQNNPDSLLWWMKRTIALRKRFKAFGRGSLEFLQPDNRKVLAFLRRYENETILIIANLSHLVQQVHLNLSQFAGWRPIELFGRVEFAPITESVYPFTLGPYGFYWFSLEAEPGEVLRIRALPTDELGAVPDLAKSVEELFDKDGWSALETLLADYASNRRWFRSKGRILRGSAIRDVVPMRFGDSLAYFVLLDVEYTEGEPETYALPLSTVSGERAEIVASEKPQALVARLRRKGRSAAEQLVLCDAMEDTAFCQSLLDMMERTRRFKGRVGEMTAMPTKAFKKARGPKGVALEASPIKAEQSNSSVVFGDRLILKLFRKLEEGTNPELEVGRFLTEKTSLTCISRVAGALEYRAGKREPMSLAILQAFVPNEGDAWRYTLDSLDSYLEYVLAHPVVQVPPVMRRHLMSLPEEPPALAMMTIGAYISLARLLGQRTAEMHLALASGSGIRDFDPEPFTQLYQTSLYQSMRALAMRNLGLLERQLESLPDEVKEPAQTVLDMRGLVLDKFQGIRKAKIPASRIRCHGDYHLGQVLYTGRDLVIIDFEGEPARSLSERRLKRCPLRDVAGMVRSFHYAAYSAAQHRAPLLSRPEDEMPVLEQWAEFWYTWVSATFLSYYLTSVRPAHLLPEDPDQIRTLLDAYLLEKAIYEVGYELNNRPTWVKVPLQGIMRLMEI